MPRHSRLRRVLKIVGGASVGALLLFAGGRTTYAPGPLFSGGLAANNWPPPPPPILPPAFLFPPPECSETDTDLALPRRLLPVRGRGAAHSHPLDAVLLPDSEVLVLAASEPAGDPGNLTCAFEGGASSPARSLGRLPGPGRHAYLCAMPQPAPAPLRAPLLLPSSAAPVPAADFPGRPLLNWGDRLVFDSALLDGGDVLVFAKGVPHLQGDVRCVYHGRADGLAASFPAITSAQQVVRVCSYLFSGKMAGRLQEEIAVVREGGVPPEFLCSALGTQFAIKSVHGNFILGECTRRRQWSLVQQLRPTPHAARFNRFAP